MPSLLYGVTEGLKACLCAVTGTQGICMFRVSRNTYIVILLIKILNIRRTSHEKTINFLDCYINDCF